MWHSEIKKYLLGVKKSLSFDSESDRLDRLLRDLRALSFRGIEDTKKQWQRTLPTGDYLLSRWERAQVNNFGEGSSVYDSSLIIGDVKVGKNTWIGPFTVLDGSGGLLIGSNCTISAGIQIYTHDTVQWAISGGVAPIVRSPVVIGDNCFIGPNVIVSKGVTIGSGCVIGANSFVNADIPDGMRAWGTPALVQPSRN